MRNIYTGIDIGSDSIKIVVSERVGDDFFVLASCSTKTQGVKKGLIVDSASLKESLEEALSKIEEQIGIRIDKAVVTVPSNECKLKVVSGEANISETGNEKKVKPRDISRVLEYAVSNQIPVDNELVIVIPILFNVDDKENIKDPKDEVGNILGVKAVIGYAPKKYIYPFLSIFEECNIEVVDIVFGSIGDYEERENKDLNKKLGAVINIGKDKINVSIFNKGILIKNRIIKLGSYNIDKDINYIYGVDLDKARDLKENFAVCSRRLADINHVIDITTSDGGTVSINQYELSEVVESRVIELLKLSKKAINNLTNRKISYIIVTGGMTELTGFSHVAEDVLGINARCLNNMTMGVRDNKYSSAFGIIKYYSKKQELQRKNYSMFGKEEIEKLMNKK